MYIFHVVYAYPRVRARFKNPLKIACQLHWEGDWKNNAKDGSVRAPIGCNTLHSWLRTAALLRSRFRSGAAANINRPLELTLLKGALSR